MNILLHKDAARNFISDTGMFNDWIGFLFKFNRSVCVKKLVDSHVVYDDSDTYIKVLRATRDIFFQPLRNVISDFSEEDQMATVWFRILVNFRISTYPD